MSKLLKVVHSEVTIKRTKLFFENEKTFPVYNIFHGEIDDNKALTWASERIKLKIAGMKNVIWTNITSSIMELSDSQNDARMVHTFD